MSRAFGATIEAIEAIRSLIVGASGSTVFVAYGDNNSELRFQKSTDAGVSWLGSPKTVDTDTVKLVSMVVHTANTISLSYIKSGVVWFAKTTNGGTSWITVQVDTAVSTTSRTSIDVVHPSTQDEIYISHALETITG
jgi:hypothetical protein